MPEEIVDNVFIDFDEKTAQWRAQFRGMGENVEAQAETMEEALAMLVEIIPKVIREK